MNLHTKVRSAMGSLYVIAILCAVFFAGGHSHGEVVGGVAVIGALVVGMVDRLVAPSRPNYDRSESRAGRRAARRNRW